MTAGCPACHVAAFERLGGVDVRRQHLAYAGDDAARARALDEHLGHDIAAYELHRCRGCGLEYARPSLAPSAAWYGALYAALDLYPSSRWEYGMVAEQLGPGDTVIDFGCGSGRFLLSVRERVRRTIGFDFSSDGIAEALAQGLDARVLDGGRAPASVAPADRASHVVAFHVLEHLPDPAALFEFASAVAADDARLWVAVPSDRRASRVYGETDVLDLPPHHLTRWTSQALHRVGEANGWTLAQFRYEPLPTRLRVWEATRRLALYERCAPAWRPVQWLWRRTLAAGVWLAGSSPMHMASGFSMLGCYTRSRST